MVASPRQGIVGRRCINDGADLMFFTPWFFPFMSHQSISLSRNIVIIAISPLRVFISIAIFESCNKSIIFHWRFASHLALTNYDQGKPFQFICKFMETFIENRWKLHDIDLSSFEIGLWSIGKSCYWVLLYRIQKGIHFAVEALKRSLTPYEKNLNKEMLGSMHLWRFFLYQRQCRKVAQAKRYKKSCCTARETSHWGKLTQITIEWALVVLLTKDLSNRRFVHFTRPRDVCCPCH